MSLASALREENDGLFQAALTHPFVAGIGDGSLPRAKFARWITQDWLYLQGYTEALDQAARLAPRDDARRFWQALSHFTREEELALHRKLAQDFGLTTSQLDSASPYACTTHYLTTLKAAAQRYPTLVASLTPCAVGYFEIANSLAEHGCDTVPHYVAWIDSYRAPAFQETVQSIETELDRCGEYDEARATVAAAYTRAARCELEFWEGLWRGH